MYSVVDRIAQEGIGSKSFVMTVGFEFKAKSSVEALREECLLGGHFSIQHSRSNKSKCTKIRNGMVHARNQSQIIWLELKYK